MAIETSEHVKQYLILSQKSADELRAICEGLQLETNGKREELLERLIQLGAPQNNDFMQPQLIPLRTRDERGENMEKAISAIQYWRQQIFNAKGNYKEFKMLNSGGSVYTKKMRYILCPQTILTKIMKDKWYETTNTMQSELVNLLQTSPERFTVTLVQRVNQKGNSWVMLHAEPKAA